MKILRMSLYFFIVVSYCLTALAEVPQLTLVIVVDQFAHYELVKHRTMFKGGFKYLLDNGIVYENAYVPHALPKTGPGHASLATGALPRDHGIVNNGWFDEKSQHFMRCEEYPLSLTHSVFPVGLSAGNLITDTLSDQLIMNSTDRSGFIVYGVSQKTAPAIFMAGFLGKAVWLDRKSKTITSSAAYFKDMPRWMKDWARLHKVHVRKDEDPVKSKDALIVAADGLMVDFASELMRRYQRHPKKLVLWISLSALDLIGHNAGPESPRVTHCLQELDRLVDVLIKQAYKAIPANNVMMILAADHGVMPTPELSKLPWAHRIDLGALDKNIKAFIKNKYGQEKIIAMIDDCSLTFNHKVFDKLSVRVRTAITDDVKMLMRNAPGMRYVWTFDELAREQFDERDMRTLFKYQLYTGRSGDIIFYVKPYTLMTKYSIGTSHQTPYEYDTHIPLILYKKGTFENKKIYDKVFIQQVVPTLAPLLEVSKPASAMMPVLPGVF